MKSQQTVNRKFAFLVMLQITVILLLSGYSRIETYLPERYRRHREPPAYFSKDEQRIGQLLHQFAIQQYSTSKRREARSRVASVSDNVLNTLQPGPYRNLNFTITLLESRSLILFEAPGAYIFISEGLVDFTDNRDELAFLLARMIAKSITRDGYNNLLRDQILNTFLRYADDPVYAGEGRPAEALNAYLRCLPDFLAVNSADRTAARLMMASGYDPWAGVSLLNRLHSSPVEDNLDPAQKRFFHTPPIHVRLASLRDAIGKLRKSEQAMDSLVTQGKDQFWWHEVGLAFGRNGQYDKAVYAFETALQIDPNMVEAHNNLAVVFKKMGQMSAAVEQYRRAMSIDPFSHVIRYNLALAFIKWNRFEEAQFELEKALEQKPDYENAHRTLYKLRRFRAQIDVYGPDSQMINPEDGMIIHPDKLPAID